MATSEKTSPSRLNGNPQQHIHARMLQTNPAIAYELVLGGWPDGVITCGVIAGKQFANSGSRPMKFQSAAPAVKTGVRLSTRPSAIHCLICPAETWPYCRPSAPMI